nr:5105_t:CDS:2 [Entrophospora candida]
MPSTTQACHVLADFSIIPMGTEVNTTKYMAEIQKILKKTNLNYSMHCSGTNIEGRWEQVMNAIRDCIDKIHELGVPRIDCNIRINTRTDKAMTMADSLRVVNDMVEKQQQ